MFSARLRQLRKELGLKRPALAAKLNISTEAVRLWEIGKRQPGHEMLCRLADFFDVSVDYLLGRIDDHRPKFKLSKQLEAAHNEGDDLKAGPLRKFIKQVVKEELNNRNGGTS